MRFIGYFPFYPSAWVFPPLFDPIPSIFPFLPRFYAPYRDSPKTARPLHQTPIFFHPRHSLLQLPLSMLLPPPPTPKTPRFLPFFPSPVKTGSTPRRPKNPQPHPLPPKTILSSDLVHPQARPSHCAVPQNVKPGPPLNSRLFTRQHLVSPLFFLFLIPLSLARAFSSVHPFF